MAYRKSSAIGDLHGRVDNLIFRTRNGKNIAYARPLNQRIPDSKKAEGTRKNFGAANKFSSSINAVPELREIWSAAKVRGSNYFQKMVSMNTRLARHGRLTTANVITPPGLPLRLDSASFENMVLRLSFVLGDDSNLSFPALLFIYLCFLNSGEEIVPLVTEIPDREPGGRYDLEVVTDIAVKKLLAKYSSPVVYLAAVGGTSYKRKVYWTSTASILL